MMKFRPLPTAISRALQLRDSVSVRDMEKHGKRWLTACEVNQHSDTILAFRKMFVEKLVWFLRREEYEDCGVDELRAFLAHITNGHKEAGGRFGNPRLVNKVKPSTVATYHRDLRALFNWMAVEGHIDVSPVERIPTPENRDDQVQPFTLDQVRALLLAAKKSEQPQRDTAVLLFMLDTGLRASEVCSLKVQDVDLSGRELSVMGKGRKRRSANVSKRTAKVMFDWLKRDECDPTDPLFAARSGESLTRSGLLQLYERLGATANLTGVRCSPHTMRHTFAIEFLRGGGNEFALMTMLGHTDLKMTQKYVAFAKADIANQHRQFSPVDRLLTTKSR